MKCFPIFIKDKPKNKNRGTGSVFEAKNQPKSQDHSDSSQTSKSFQSSKSIPELYKEKQQNLRVFSLEELSDATNGFDRTLKIGEGGFGSVYKGTIKPLGGRGHPLVVAVKKLNTHGLQVFLLLFFFFSLVFLFIVCENSPMKSCSVSKIET